VKDIPYSQASVLPFEEFTASLKDVSAVTARRFDVIQSKRYFLTAIHYKRIVSLDSHSLRTSILESVKADEAFSLISEANQPDSSQTLEQGEIRKESRTNSAYSLPFNVALP
jgi:hypothetical protein